jgi:RNA polymerase sigma-70 factor, ECF subfamily
MKRHPDDAGPQPGTTAERPRVAAAVPCLMRAWEAHERALLGWLTRQLGDRAHADDLLQDVFLKCVRYGASFCSTGNPRAWLFEVARNTLADHLRRGRDSVELPEDLRAVEEEATAPVESLAACLPRVLAELSPDDREAITQCDLEGRSQADYAAQLGMSLPGAKSRVQRARARLRERLTIACELRFDGQGSVCCFTPCGSPKLADE